MDCTVSGKLQVQFVPISWVLGVGVRLVVNVVSQHFYTNSRERV